MIRPDLGGMRRTFPFPQMLRALIDLIPILFLFGLIVGSIYAGWATPTEAAAVGVAGPSLVIALVFGGVSWVDAAPEPHGYGQNHIHDHA